MFKLTIYQQSSLLIYLLFLSACGNNLDFAIEKAGDNKAEIKKILEYFKDDSDPLKYEAAKFLILNMPYNYSASGEFVEKYDSIYLLMASTPIQDRDSIFKCETSKFNYLLKKSTIDIETIKSEDIISHINEMCDLWHSTKWNSDYSSQLFFDYVIPYRLLNEPISDWHTTINSEFPNLKSNEIRSKRGIIMEAEENSISFCKIIPKESASQGKMVLLNNPKSSVSFKISSQISTKKDIHIRYTSTYHQNKITILLNDEYIQTINLAPTNNMNTFHDSKTGISVNLKEGDNTISLKYESEPIGLDYIQLSSVEQLVEENNIDFSFHQTIQNKYSKNYVTFTLKDNPLLKTIKLKPLKALNNTNTLELHYQGYGCWRISPAKNDSLCLEVMYCQINENTPIGQYKYLNGNHQKWVFIPIEDGYYKIMGKDSGLFLESKRLENGEEIIVQTTYANRDTQKWKLESKSKNKRSKDLFSTNSAISEALKVFDETNKFEWIAFNSNIPPKASSLCIGKTGNCRDEASYTVLLCRHLGIPAAIDFTPHWGNRSQGHSWSVLIKPNGKSVPFYMGCTPGDTAHYYHSYIKPKIFRHRFSLNEEIYNDLIHEKEIPHLFRTPKFTDVTEEYYNTTNVIRDVPSELSNNNIAYICVFDNRNWIPVHYGKIVNRKVEFKSMGRNILYMAAILENGKIKPFGLPFIVTANGDIKDINTNMTVTQEMKLFRKYPFFGKQDHFNGRMSGGKFQGSNQHDFSEKVDFHIHEGITNGNWYNISINTPDKFRFVRYIGPNGSYCNVNEIEFYSTDGNILKGEIIGTEGKPNKTKENVFDGDILTGFEGISPDGHWVGLRLKKPVSIGRIKYIPRNDGNSIEIGDKYELMYWTNNCWTSLGIQVAESNILIYKDMPSGGLYILRNLTKGHEERIFTYENGQQIWW